MVRPTQSEETGIYYDILKARNAQAESVAEYVGEICGMKLDGHGASATERCGEDAT